MRHQTSPSPNGEDLRVNVTVRLWKIAALMLFVANAPSSRPALHSLIISLTILCVTLIGTLIVWRFVKGQQEQEVETAMTQKRLAELEERLANLETINNFERRLAEEALKRHAVGRDTSPNLPTVSSSLDEDVTTEK